MVLGVGFGVGSTGSGVEPDMANYSSAELSADQLEEQFRRDERAGLMLPTTEAAVEAVFGPGRLLVAAMGAVAKPNGEVRPLHDGTHGIGLNNKIRVLTRSARAR